MADNKLTDTQLRKNSGMFIHESLFAEELQKLKDRVAALEAKNP